jgi:hypothetical protein
VKFWLGLAIGAAVGSAAMYLGMERPWSRPTPVTVAAPVAADAGVAPAPGKRRRRGGGPRGGAGGAAAGGDEAGDSMEPAVVLTDADRRLEWRGDDVALPRQQVDMAARDDARALDSREIQATIARDGQAILDCVVRATGQASLEATVTVKMLVDGSGRAVKSRIQAPAYLFGNGLLPCARRAIQGLGFPATGAPTVVTQPFDLF